MKIKKIKILDSNTRCPYCGELVDLPIKSIPRGVPKKRCEVCGGLYTFEYNMAVILAWYVLGLILFIYIIGFRDILSFLWYLFLLFVYISFYPVYWNHYPLRPLEKIRWGICSSYDIILKINSLDRKYFKKNMIYPICFIDDNSMPISKYCCIKVTEIKNKGKTAYCVITDLPYGEKIDERLTKYNFNVFFDKRIIGTGKVLQ